jgi:hypothetical protein
MGISPQLCHSATGGFHGTLGLVTYRYAVGDIAIRPEDCQQVGDSLNAMWVNALSLGIAEGGIGTGPA